MYIDNIKLDVVEMGLGELGWIGLAQDSYSSCQLGNEPSGSVKCWESIEWLQSWWPLQ
jgi:hypothetical protein